MTSVTPIEALQRIVSAFPAEIQNSVAAQLADCLVGVIAQRLVYRPEVNIRAPECEVLDPTFPIKNFIRNRDFFKIPSALETGADQGMWTFPRYKNWLDRRTSWHVPNGSSELDAGEFVALASRQPEPALRLSGKTAEKPGAKPSANAADGERIEIEPVAGGLGEVLKKLR